MVLVTFKVTLVKVGHQQMEERRQHLKQNTAFSEGTKTLQHVLDNNSSLHTEWQNCWRDVKIRRQEGLE